MFPHIKGHQNLGIKNRQSCTTVHFRSLSPFHRSGRKMLRMVHSGTENWTSSCGQDQTVLHFTTWLLVHFKAGQCCATNVRQRETDSHCLWYNSYWTSHSLLKQEAQLMLTTGSTRLAVSRGQQTWYKIPHVTYSFLLCNSNFVFKTRSFYDIRLQKISWPWNGGQRSLKVIESDIIR